MSTPTQQEILAAHVAARRVLDAMRYRLRVAEYERDRELSALLCACDHVADKNTSPVSTLRSNDVSDMHDGDIG